MSIQATPLPTLVVPENAPFTPEQRAWLSGFLIAAIAPHAAGITPLSAAEAAALVPGGGAAPPGAALASNDDAPWHDPAMPADERMKLAEGKPLAPRLMAAMAQQDCGQCGYNCADYANAIFAKSEARLNLCAPGGKVTARLLKGLAEELARAPAITGDTVPAEARAAPEAKPGTAPGYTRELPVESVFLGRRKLNREGSEKSTWHIDIDLTDSGIEYAVGDSFGVFPRNDLGLVDQIIAVLGCPHTAPLRGSTLRQVLQDQMALNAAPDALFELFSYITGGKTRDKARALARGEDPDGDAQNLDVLAALQKFAGVRPHPEAFVDALDELQPRLYSISSSPKATPGRVSLTVDAVRYLIGKRVRSGVASTFLAERIAPNTPIKCYVQKAHNFSPPDDPTKPIIMVGPGTGIAPFRAFLLERQATLAPGRNWLFFGHQRQATDFFYRDELQAMKQAGVLTRLSLAWSRDGKEKYYVQDRMREVGAELWQWLAQDGHIYVCGDAKRMAKDVEAALVEIVATHGMRTTEEAITFVNGLKKAGRYQADVY